MLLVAPALLAAAQPCPSNPLNSLRNLYDNPDPAEASGPGLWIAGAAFASADIASARASLDQAIERWGIEIVFTAQGKARFDAIQQCRLNEPIEVSFDAELLSRPRLVEHIRGRTLMISGEFTQESAIALAGWIASAR